MAGEIATIGQIAIGVRRLLLRPSDLELPQADIVEELNDICRGKVEQLKMAPRERSTTVSDLQLTYTGPDYAVNLENAPDFEEVMLETALNSSSGSGDWCKVDIVPLNNWALQFDQEKVIAAFYGSSQASTPAMVKLNLQPEQVATRSFRLTYRLPMVSFIQEGDRPPLPAAHLPMLKYEAAILLGPQVLRTSEAWLAWLARNVTDKSSVYMMKLADLRENWQAYLDSGDGSQIEAIRPWNDFRRRGTNGRIHPIIPLQ